MTDMQATVSQIEEDLQSNTIVLFMKGNKLMPQCGFSARVVDILNSLEVEFETRDVLADPMLRQAIKDYSDWPTLPQLYIKGEFVGGCDIVSQLFENGELHSLIS